MINNNKAFWGILLVVIGTAMLFARLDLLDINWRALAKLWPLLLIFWGIMMIVPLKKASHSILLILGLIVVGLFSYHQISKNTRDYNIHWNQDRDEEENSSSGEYRQLEFKESLAVETKKAKFSFDAGAGSFNIGSEAESLISINGEVERTDYKFSIDLDGDEAITSLEQKKTKIKVDSENDFQNNLDIKLNSSIPWDVDVDLGAAMLDMDFRQIALNHLEIDCGASKIEIYVGDKQAFADINIDTGVSSIVINIPEGMACRVKAETGLSTKSFDGLQKIGENLWESDDYENAEKKVSLDLDAGLSAIKLRKY